MEFPKNLITPLANDNPEELSQTIENLTAKHIEEILVAAHVLNAHKCEEELAKSLANYQKARSTGKNEPNYIWKEPTFDLPELITKNPKKAKEIIQKAPTQLLATILEKFPSLPWNPLLETLNPTPPQLHTLASYCPAETLSEKIH
jgi:hypothetical protein